VETPRSDICGNTSIGVSGSSEYEAGKQCLNQPAILQHLEFEFIGLPVGCDELEGEDKY
jgi:hypothetical protein